MPEVARHQPGRFGLIIGGMKCGTTTLFQVLAQHPQVASCREKEPDFFASDERFARGLDSYLGLWDWDPGRHLVALEASTAYSKDPWFPGVPERIAASLPAARCRFIYMVRHPVRRIASQVRHGLYEGWVQPLDDGIEQELVDISRYAAQLDRYLEFFRRDQIMVVPLEEYQAAPERILTRVCAFLEIDPAFVFQNPERVVNSGALFEMPSGLASVAKVGVVRRLLDSLPTKVRQGIRESLARIASGLRGRTRTARGELAAGRWEPTPGEVAMILDELTPDLQRLRSEWHIDVEGLWGISMGDAARGGNS